MFRHFRFVIMVKKLYGVSYRLYNELIPVCKLFVCVFFILPAFIMNDEFKNITVFESNMNYTMYNDSYENITILNQNMTDLEDDNKSSDVATELESTISVTEDSDSFFQSENNKKLFHFLTPDEDICNCDLTSNMCDINCCCDPDCGEEDMQIFSDCSHQVLTPDENYCYQKDIIFRNNTIYKMVKDPSSSMFCIVHDNFKHRLRFKDMPVLKSHRDLITVLNYKYSTTYSWDTDSEKQFESSELRAGSPIFITSNKKMITNRWSLPSSCLSDLCSCGEEVRFLREFRSTCTHRISNLSRACDGGDELLSADHVTDFCLDGGGGDSLADLVLHTMMQTSSGNATTEDEDRQATGGGKVCVRTDRRRRRPRLGEGVCEDVVSGVHFRVEFRTSGITGIEASFRYVDVPSDGQSVTQTYSVSFFSRSNASEPAEKRSGNPGYRVGLPILASVNGSSEEEEDDDYERGSSPRKFDLSVLDSDPDGFCSRDRRRTLGFGRNLKTGCVLSRRPFAGCRALRTAISELLMGPLPPVFVGAFGNANASDPEDWIEVFHDPATGKEEEDPCRVSLGLRLEVVYAAVGTVANPQNKIVGVACRRARPVDLACTRSTCEDVRLTTSVSFFDVTLPAVEHRAKVPSVKANLPADFFYPFLYAGGTAAPVPRTLLLLLLAFCLPLMTSSL